MLRPVSHPDLSKGVCPTRIPIIGYIRHHHPSQGVHPVHLAPPLPPLRPVCLPRSGLFYARFQPILGTQKCFPRDFRDQFSIFPKIFWIRGLFFQKCVANFGWGKGPFLPGGRGGGVVALCLPACRRSRCPVLRSGPVPGLDRPGPDWITTGGRKTGGPVSISPASDLARVGWLYGDFQPCGIFSPSGPLVCPVAGFLASGGLSYLPGGDRGPWGFSGPLAGLWLVGLGLPAGLRCLFGADGVPGLISGPAYPLAILRPVSAWTVWACFGPSGASSLWVWCVVVVWCFSSSTGQKKNGPGFGSFLSWWCGGVSSTGISLAGLAWIRSRYAGRASPL